MHGFRLLAPALALAALIGCSRDRGPRFVAPSDGMDKWDGTGGWTGDAPLPFSIDNVMYLGGPVMEQSNPTVYVLWYGDWTPYAAAQQVLMNFLKDLSGSGYWQIVHSWQANQQTTLGFESGMPLPGRVSTGFRSGQSAVDLYSRGSLLSFPDVAAIVDDAVSNNVLNLVNADDPNSIWLLLPSPDVADTSGFCGYHSLLFPFFNGGLGTVKFAFVATRESLGGACNPANRAVSPNGNPMADAMVNVIAHEPAEAMSDPNPIFEAWSSLTFPGEIGDHCNFRFGPTYRTANGAFANQHWGSHDYLVQELLAPTVPQTCAQSAVGQ